MKVINNSDDYALLKESEEYIQYIMANRKDNDEIFVFNEPIPEDFNGDALFYQAIGKYEVKYKFITSKLYESLNKLGERAKNKLSIGFIYNNDPREIFEIPEIKEYCKELFNQYPNILYFISGNELKQTLLQCCVNCKVIKKEGGNTISSFDTDEMNLLAQYLKKSILKYANSIRDFNTDEIVSFLDNFIV